MLKAENVVLKALGLGHHARPSDEDISRHKLVTFELEQWGHFTDKISAILTSLAQNYASAKGEIPMTRYGTLKTMIKQAMEQFSEVQQEVVNKTMAPGSGRKIAESEAHAPSSVHLMLALTTQYLDAATKLADQAKKYSEMTDNELQFELTEGRRQVLQLKQDYYKDRDKLQILGGSYEESKQLNAAKRYKAMKKMVKEATRKPL